MLLQFEAAQYRSEIFINENLVKGKPVQVFVNMKQVKNSTGLCRLLWAPPEVNATDPQQLMDRVANEPR